MTLLLVGSGALTPLYAQQAPTNGPNGTTIYKMGQPLARGEEIPAAGRDQLADAADAAFPGLDVGTNFKNGGGTIVIGDMDRRADGTNNGRDIGVREGKNTNETMGRIIHEMLHVHFCGGPGGALGKADPCTHAMIHSYHAKFLVDQIVEAEQVSLELGLFLFPPSCRELQQVMVEYLDYMDKCAEFAASGGVPTDFGPPPPPTPTSCQ